MNTVTYIPAEIFGTLAMPPSKSAAHRAILYDRILNQR